MDDLDALVQLAEAATPGPWEWEPEGFMGCGQVWTQGEGVEGGSIAGPTGDCYPRSGYNPKGDMQFIAACDPATILALVRRVKEAEATAQVKIEKQSKWDALMNRAFAAEARVQELEAEVTRLTWRPKSADELGLIALLRTADEHAALRAGIRELIDSPTVQNPPLRESVGGHPVVTVDFITGRLRALLGEDVVDA